MHAGLPGSFALGVELRPVPLGFTCKTGAERLLPPPRTPARGGLVR